MMKFFDQASKKVVIWHGYICGLINMDETYNMNEGQRRNVTL